jgi:predicted nucleic acid-binding protein
MDFADASLIAIAEARALRAIFTLDARFRSYRLRNRRHLAVVPR